MAKRTSSGEPIHRKTGEPTNAARARRVHNFIKEYQRAFGPGDDLSAALRDFTTDVLHFAQRKRININELLDRAREMYKQEQEAEQ